MREFEHTGNWWLPDHEDHSVPGSLRFSRSDGLSLTLHGSLYPNTTMLFDLDEEAAPIILGVASNQRFTYCESLVASLQNRFPGPSQVVYRHGHVLVGQWITRAELMMYTKMQLQFPHLMDLAPQVSRVDSRFEREKNLYSGYCVSHKPGVVLSAKFESVAIEVTSWALSSSSPDGMHHLQEIVAVEISSTSPQPLRVWLDTVQRPLQDLLTLATDTPAAVTAMHLFPAESAGIEHRIPVEVAIEQINYPDAPRRLNPQDMLFTLQGRETMFESIVQRWFHAAQELWYVMALFFSIRYRPGYLDSKFLNLISAVEGYHTVRFPEATAIDPAELEGRMDALFSALPPNVAGDAISWARQRLTNNAPSLRQRVAALMAMHPAVSALVPDSDAFARDVADMRHRIAHGSRRRHRNVTNESAQHQMFSHTQILTMLLQSCFLSELGLDLQLVEQQALYKHLLSRRT